MTVQTIRHQSFQLIKVTYAELAARNVVWLNKKDYLKFFESVNQPHYLSIANLIYQAEPLKGLSEGKIGLNNAQYTDIRKSVFLNYESEIVFATALFHPCKTWAPINTITFEIKRDPDVEAWNGLPATSLSLDSLREQVRNTLDRKIVHKNQAFLLKHDTGNYRLIAKDFKLDAEHSQTSQLLGRIACTTHIDFQTEQAEHIFIVDRIVNKEEVENYIFEVKLIRTNVSDQIQPRPMKVDSSRLTDEIIKHFGEKNCIVDQKYTANKSHGWKLEYRLASVNLKNAIEDRNPHYKQAFKLTDKNLIRIHFNPEELVITKTLPLPLRELEIKLLEHTGSYADKELEPNQKSWVSQEEFEQAVKNLNRQFAKGERFYFKLSSGEYLAEVSRAVGKVGTRDDTEERYKNAWCLESDTKLEFKSSDVLGLKYIDTATAYPLKKLNVEVKVKTNIFFSSDKITLLKQENLLKAFLHNVKKELVVKDHIFTDVADEGKVRLTITSMEAKDGNPKTQYGFLGNLEDQTEIEFVPEGKVRVISKETEVHIADPIRYLEEQGVGGLSKQMEEIVRNIFLGRGPMRDQMIRRGIEPPRGILFYGPPGTGKTLLAKTLSKMLGTLGENVQMISGPEIFDKFNGESQKNVRELFKPAREAPNRLFVIIINEIDSMLGKRKDTFNEVDNKVVNQFLAEIDGAKSLNNILVIGMTNRIDTLDPATTRPGRLELKIEVGLPNSIARKKIFEIHTQKIREKELIEKNIDFDELVQRTEGWSGADIEGCIKRAIFYSLERLNKQPVTKDELNTHPAGVTTWSDFIQAIKEVNPIPQQDSPHLTMFG